MVREDDDRLPLDPGGMLEPDDLAAWIEDAIGADAAPLPDASGEVAAGADGLIIEVHPSPETAASDGIRSVAHN